MKKSGKKVSKGERNNVNRTVVNSIRAKNKNPLREMMNKLDALANGFDPKILVPNTDSSTNRKAPFVKMELRKFLAQKSNNKHEKQKLA